MENYPRDFKGYGANPPDPHWPGEAYIAVQFVLNYEEGGERCLLDGDEESEAFLSEIVGAEPWYGQRHWNIESLYEYGARAGFWRLWRLFTEYKLGITVFGVARALEKAPEQVNAMQKAGWEIACHGLKWIEHRTMAPEEERAQILEAMNIHKKVTGKAPKGWYTGRCSINTLRLLAENADLAYLSDSYADDLPYWFRPEGLIPETATPLIVPYTLDSNDMRFATPQGFNAGDQFFTYLKDSFDYLYEEGKAGSPKMLSIGLHNRLVGRPGRTASLKRFIDYILGFDRVWVARREEIAGHWRKVRPLDGAGRS